MIWFFAVLAAALLAADPAHAGPLVAAITTAFTALKSSVIGAFLIRTAVSIGLSLLAQALRPKPKTPGQRIDAMQAGEDQPQGFPIGRYLTGGHLEYQNSHGNAGGTPNAYFTIVASVSDVGPVNLRRLRINDQWGEIGSTAHPRYGYPITTFRRGSTDYAWIRWYDGSQTAADIDLVDIYGNDPDQPWTQNHKLLGCAYAIVTIRFNRDVFQGVPRFAFEVDGIPLYDPRKDSTVGGSGSHRWGDQSTWETSDNPAVQVYNVLRGIPIGGEIYGGGIDAEDIPLSNAIAGMNVCDDVLDGRPRFRAGLMVWTDQEPAQIIEDLLTSALGQISEVGGVWRTRWGPPATPVLTFSDEDISISDQQQYAPFPGLSATHNAIRASFHDPERLWETAQTPLQTNAEWETEDGNRRLMAQLTLSAVYVREQAQQVCDAYIKDARRWRQHQIVLPPEAQVLEALDTVEWSSQRNGYIDKEFEVVAAVYQPRTMMVALTLRERDPSDYDWSDSNYVPLPPGMTITPPPVRVIPETEWGVEGATVFDGAGNPRRPGGRAFWSASVVEDARQVAYTVENAASPHAQVTSGLARPEVGEVVFTDGVIGGEEYRVTIRPVIPGRETEPTQPKTFIAPAVFFDEADLGPIILGRIQDAQDEAAQAGQDAQDAFTAAQNASDKVDAIDQKLLDDLADILDELDGLDPSDITDARRRAILALRDGWLVDPSFNYWEGGNLKADNWQSRTGIATHGSHDEANGLYGSSLFVDKPAGSGVVQVVTSETTGLLGADIDDEWLVITILIDVLAMPDRFETMWRVEWRQGSSAWTGGRMFGINNAGGRFTQHGIEVKPGVVQGKQVLVQRPSGTFDQMRYLLMLSNGSNADAVQARVHLLNIRPATEAEIATHDIAQDLAAEVATRTTEVQGLTLSLASLETSVTGRLDSAEAGISNLDAVKITAGQADAIADQRVSAGLSASPVGDIRALVNTRVATRTTPTEATALANTAISSSMSGGALGQEFSSITATLDNLAATRVTAAGAVSAVNQTISAQYGNNIATVAQRATTAANRTGEIYARQYLGATTGDGNTASLELISFNAGTGGSSASAIMLNADNIFLDGTVSLPKLVVTDFSGNLIPNGAFKYGDSRGWNAFPSDTAIWAVWNRSSSGNWAVQNAPTEHFLRMNAQASDQLHQITVIDGVKPGEQFSLSFDYAGSSDTSSASLDLWAFFYDKDGQILTGNGASVANISDVWWRTWEGAVTAPANAARLDIRFRRRAGGSGNAFATNISVIRQRKGTTLILPESITTPLIFVDEAFIGKLQAFEAWIQSAHIANATIGRLKIGNREITVPVQSTGGRVNSQPQEQVVNTLVINLPEAQPLVIWWSFEHEYISGTPWWGYRITINNNTVAARNAPTGTDWMEAPNDFPGSSVEAMGVAGTNTIRLHWRCTTANGTVNMLASRLIATGFLR